VLLPARALILVSRVDQDGSETTYSARAAELVLGICATASRRCRLRCHGTNGGVALGADGAIWSVVGAIIPGGAVAKVCAGATGWAGGIIPAAVSSELGFLVHRFFFD